MASMLVAAEPGWAWPPSVDCAWPCSWYPPRVFDMGWLRTYSLVGINVVVDLRFFSRAKTNILWMLVLLDLTEVSSSGRLY
jgi:hypothetical protein